MLLSGCAHNAPSLYGRPGVAPSAHEPWIPPARALTPSLPEQPKVAIPEDLLTSSRQWSLADVVDVALRSSSETRAAWAAARSAAAAYGSRRGDYLPDVNVGASVVRQRSASSGAKPAEEQRTYASSADFTWLLFNFGGRRAAVEETRQALLAANWTQNAVIQSVVLRVEQAYYQYVTAKALLAAESATLEDAQANLNSAEERHRSGLATIADVLQARTALSQVQLALAGLNGRIATRHLARARGPRYPCDADRDREFEHGRLYTWRRSRGDRGEPPARVRALPAA
jgi:outer membrane protein TolC